ncbi:MAG: thermonuclease family protein [Burkholderiaceae bacterium]|nr:thermonuclease family protein [Burkholderiaceae bacterium]
MKFFNILIFLLAFVANVQAAQFEARVLRVSDGDTITVIDSQNQRAKVRFLGIDAPEFKQSYGKASLESLRRQIYSAGNKVTVVYDRRDGFGRIVGKVLADDKDLNLEQIRRGMAWAFKRYFRDVAPSDRQKYIEAEEMARKEGKGLWSQNNPMPPWEWRRENRR